MNLEETIDQARALGVEAVEMNGVKYIIGATRSQRSQPVVETAPGDLISPLSVLDEYSDEEIQYWATPFFDEIQAKKESQKSQQQVDDELKKTG